MLKTVTFSLHSLPRGLSPMIISYPAPTDQVILDPDPDLDPFKKELRDPDLDPDR